MFKIGIVQDKFAFSDTVAFMKMASALKVDHVELKYELKTEREQLLSKDAAPIIGSISKQNEISLSVHAPYDEGVNFGDERLHVQKNTREHMITCLDFCRIIKAEYVTVHGGYFEVSARPLVKKTMGKGQERISLRSLVPPNEFLQLKKRVLSAFQWFKDEADKRGLIIAIENLHDFSDFKVRFPITPEDILECTDFLGDDVLITYDSGHGHSTNNSMIDFVRKIGSHKIAGTHLHDNDKSSDQHLPIYRGTVGFSAFFRDYFENEWSFPLNVEVKNYEDLIDSLETLQEFRRNSSFLKGGGGWDL